MEGVSAPSPTPVLSREITDLLFELSIGLQKAAIYPRGHPILDKVASGVLRRLEAVLANRSAFLIGVAPTQLVIDALATDAGNPVLRGLAARLHQHQIGSIRLTHGVTVDELEHLMGTIGAAGVGIDRPIGLEGPEVLSQWAHVRLMPLNFGSLELADGESISVEDAEALWIRLVQIALAGLATPGTEPDAARPADVAQAIEQRDGDTEYDQAIVNFLQQVTTAINTTGARDASSIRSRVSELVQKLGPSTLQRLLQMGGDAERRQRFLREAVSAVTADAVIDLVVAAATASQQTISTSMMRMLGKLATHAEEGSGNQAMMADVALRQQVTALMEGWTLGETDPDGYRRALDRLAARDPLVRPTDIETPVEPARLLMTALEVGVLGSSVWSAVDEMIGRGEWESLIDLLDQATHVRMVERIWLHLATPRQLVALLSQRAWSPTTAARLVDQMGIAAAPVVIEFLETTEGAAERERLLALLTRLGSPVARVIVDELPQVRWPTLLQLLTLLGRHPTWLPSFDPSAWTAHPDPEVRREAIRQLLRDPQQQSAVLVWALADPEEGTLRIALAAAMTHCPKEVASVLKLRAEDETLGADLRALALRAIAGCKAPDTPAWLIERLLKPGRFLRRATLLPTTPERLAALEGLAVHWGNHPAAAEVLTLARASGEVAVRNAVAPRPSRR